MVIIVGVISALVMLLLPLLLLLGEWGTHLRDLSVTESGGTKVWERKSRPGSGD